MGVLRKLASQTAVYGLSSIAGRFINYLLVPLYTYSFSPVEYGVVSEFYAYAGFFSVLLLLGFETGYFRFREAAIKAEPDLAYSTALIFVLLLNLGFFLLIEGTAGWLSAAIQYAGHPEYVLWFAMILAMDAASAIPFARLRALNQAFKFAGIKLLEIMLTVFFSLFFIVYCPRVYQTDPDTWIALVYNPGIGVGYVFIANLMASACKFLVLSPQLKGMAWGFDFRLFTRMWRYSWPMVVVGFAGIINEMLDRVLLKYWLPYDAATNLAQLGIYSACYKLSVLMTLFIQAFRYAAEPFFFSHASQGGSRQVYADVLRCFVIFCVFIFLVVTLFLDFFQFFIGVRFREGLSVVPVLLMANLFLGIYVNLSVWYKLTDHTGMGAWVAIIGAGLTVLLNIWWIPLYGYQGSAWATLICYGFMALLSYVLGQRYFAVGYPVKRILAYMALGIVLIQIYWRAGPFSPWQPWLLASAVLSVYLLTVVLFERRYWLTQRIVE
ncbi:MAG: polysaccharide biosynthesis protein [Methylobacter sp.]|nr:MAG: polysaccharide biosynthesis protein [Methylobacter sp.]